MRHSAWLLAVVLGVGSFSFIGFLYCAIRIRSRKWWKIAAVVGVLTAIAWVLLLARTGTDGAATVGGGYTAALWIGLIPYGFFVNRDYLDWRAKQAQADAPSSTLQTPAGRIVGQARGAGATRRTRRQARRAAGPRPRRPRRRRVRRQRIGFAPPSTIWDMADNCVKCGRPLTDPRSRRARVGTTCVRIYGSQQRRVPNPRHSAWIDRKTTTDAAYRAEKVRADTEFARATTAYEEARAEWTRVRAAR